MDCIIGSACIRDFSTATEVLQGKVPLAMLSQKGGESQANQMVGCHLEIEQQHDLIIYPRFF